MDFIFSILFWAMIWLIFNALFNKLLASHHPQPYRDECYALLREKDWISFADIVEILQADSHTEVQKDDVLIALRQLESENLAESRERQAIIKNEEAIVLEFRKKRRSRWGGGDPRKPELAHGFN